MHKFLKLAAIGAVCCAMGFASGKLFAQTGGVSPGFKLMLVEIPATDTAALTEYYSNVLGLADDFDFASNIGSFASNHLPISADEVYLQVNERTEDDSAPVIWFIVDDLAAFTARVEANGGTVLNEPFEIALTEEHFNAVANIVGDELAGGAPATGDTFGQVVFILDPEGNELAFVEIEEFGHPLFSFGEHAIPLSDAQIVAHQQAMERGQAFIGSSVEFASEYR